MEKLLFSLAYLLVFALCYVLSLLLINKIADVELKNENGKINLRNVWLWLFGGIGAVTVFAVTFLISPDMSVQKQILFIIIMIGSAALAFSDKQKQTVPNKYLLILLIAWGVFAVINILVFGTEAMQLIVRSAVGGLLGGLMFFLCYILSKKQLGGGDVKFAAIMGLYLTMERLIGALLYGVVICCIFSIVQLIRKKFKLKSNVPLIPFLYLGIIISYLLLPEANL